MLVSPCLVVDLRSHLDPEQKEETSQIQRIDTIKAIGSLLKSSSTIVGHAVSDGLVYSDSQHSLISTIDKAFREHRSLALTPDDLLLPLIQASAVIRNLRENDVKREKLQLVVRRDDFSLLRTDNPWNEVFAEFRTKIESYVGKEQKELYSGSFSTTKDLQQAAYDVSLMDAFQSQFSYHNMFMCGIPSITLLGTQDDWTQFHERAFRILDTLEKVDEEWKAKLKETISNIVGAVGGSTTPEKFWCDIYRWGMHSGGAGINGWINFFFPIIRHHGKLSIGDLGEITGKSSFGRHRHVDTFPGSLSSVPVTCNDRGQDFSLRYYAGQVGVSQNEQGIISPAWGWAVVTV